MPARSHTTHCLLIPIALSTSAMSLQGCITSQFPLLDDKSAIADPYFAGRYHVVGIDKSFDVEVYLRGTKYLLVQEGKFAYLGTVHNWRSGAYLTQLRPTSEIQGKDAKGPSNYVYFLLRKSSSGAEMNFIPCTGDCDLKDVNDLSNFADDTKDNFTGSEFVTARKTADLGQ